MQNPIKLNGKVYISSRRAAKIAGYAGDYIGQLCRSGKLDCTRVGRVWYVTEESLVSHKQHADQSLSIQYKIQQTTPPAEIAKHAPVYGSDDPLPTFVPKIDPLDPSTPLAYSADQGDLIPSLKKSEPSSKSAKILGARNYFSNELSQIVLSSMLIVSSVFGVFTYSTVGIGQDPLSQTVEHAATAVAVSVGTIATSIGAVAESLAKNHSAGPVQFAAAATSGFGNAVTSATSWFKGAYSNLLAYFGFNGGAAGSSTNSLTNLAVNQSAGGSTATSSASSTLTLTSSSTPALASSASSTAAPASSSSSALAISVPAPQTIIERIVSPSSGSVRPAVLDDVTSAQLQTQIQNLSNQFESELDQRLATLSLNLSTGGSFTGAVSSSPSPQSYYVSTPSPIDNVYQEIAASQQIDQLSGTAITNPTITNGTLTGGSISGASISDATIIGSSTFSGTTGIFSGDLSAGGNFSLGGNITVSGTATSTFAGSSIFDTSTLVIDSFDHFVGIGTTSPSAALAVEGSSLLGNSATAGYFIATTSTASQFPNASTTVLSVAGTAYFPGSGIWNSSGNVGIGTTSPFANLSVVGSGYFSGDLNAGGAVTSTATSTASAFVATAAASTSTFAGALTAAGATGLTVFQNGLVMIGTTTASSSAALTVVQHQNGAPIFQGYRSTDTAPSGDLINISNAAGTQTLFRVDNSGNILAGGILNSGSVSIVATAAPQLRVEYSSGNEFTTSVNSTGATSFGFNGGTPSASWAPQTSSVNTFNFTDASSQSVLSIDTLNHRIGIGTTTPGSALSIAGVGNFASGLSTLFSSLTAPYFTATSSTASTFPYASTTALTVSGTAYFPGSGIWNSSGNVGIGTTSPDYTLDVAGDIGDSNGRLLLQDQGGTVWTKNNELDNGSGGAYFVGNVGIGTTSPWATLSVTGNSDLGNSALAGYFVATSSTATSTFAGGITGPNNFTVQSSSGNVGIGTTSPQTLLGLQGGIGVNSSQLYLAANGNVGVGTTTSSANFDVAGKNSSFNSNQDGSLGAWSTNSNALPVALYQHTSVVANGYVYAIGGVNNAGARSSAVYYAKLNADGSVGSWLTNQYSLPVAINGHASVVNNGYIYVVGGDTGNAVTSVYYAQLNADGSTGQWSKNINNMPLTRRQLSSVVANGYIYAIGGKNSSGTAVSTVFYAKLNADGSVGAWSTEANSLPNTVTRQTSVVANGYVYAIGGSQSGTQSGSQGTVYYAKLNADGSTGVWSTGVNALPTAIGYEISAAVSNGYLYTFGGFGSGSASSIVYFAKLNPDGSTGTWSSGTTLPQAMCGQSTVVSNGYVYILGGNTTGTCGDPGANNTISTVYYTSTARVEIAGDLDLLGLTAGGSPITDSSGAVGGSIYAGNIYSGNNLEVSGNTELWNGLSVSGPVSIIGATSTISSPLFNIATTSGFSLFNVQSGGNVGIGTTTPGTVLSIANVGNFASGISTLYSSLTAPFFTATSSTASTFPYASTTALTVSGTNGLQLASTLNGAIQAINGLISATSTLSIAYGGTGLSTAPTYGQFLMGNALNAYALTATSSLGLLGSSTVSSLTTNYIPKWNSNGTFVNSLVYDNGTNVGIGTTTPGTALSIANVGNFASGNSTLYSSLTAPYFTATSSTASTFPYASTTALTVSGTGFVQGNIVNTTPANSTYVKRVATVSPSGGASGYLNSVAVSGNYAYVGGTSISIVDVSNPSNPTVVDTFNPGGSGSDSLAVAGHYLYTANQNTNSLSVVDISNHASPTVVSTLGLGVTPYGGIAISGHYVYIDEHGNNLVSVVDVSNPYNPILVTTLAVNTPEAIAISGNYLYVASAYTTDALYIFNISNPSVPVLTDIYSGLGGNPTGVAVSGRYAYVTAFTGNAMYVIDVSNPYSPSIVGAVGFPSNNPYGIAISGRYAYVTDNGNATMSFVDVSSSTAPVLLGNATVGTNPSGIAVSGRYAYVGNQTDGTMSVVDLSGTETTALVAGSAGIGQLQVWNDINAGGQLSVTGGITAGGGLNVAGPTNIFASSSSSGSVFSINNISGTPALVSVLGNGDVGVGTTTPYARLSITGSGTGSTPDFVFANSSNVPQDVIEDNGSVGIGTTSPVANLGIQGSIGVNSSQLYLDDTGNVGVGTNRPGFPLDVRNGTIAGGITNIAFFGSTDNLGLLVRHSNYGNNHVDLVGTQIGVSGNDIQLNTNDISGGLTVQYEGNVGVGTGESTIGSPLSVNGGISAGTYSATAAPTNGLIVSGDTGIGTTSPFASLSVSTSTANYTGQTLLSVANSSNSTLFNVLGNGNVGIGTTTPATALDVHGDITDESVLNAPFLLTNSAGKIAAGTTLGLANGGTGTTTGGVTNGVEYYNGTNLTNGTGFVYSGGNVGIGTTNPGADGDKLEVVDGNFAVDTSATPFDNWTITSSGESTVRMAGNGPILSAATPGNTANALNLYATYASAHEGNIAAIESQVSALLFKSSGNAYYFGQADTSGGANSVITTPTPNNAQNGNNLVLLGGATIAPQTVTGGNVYIAGGAGAGGGAAGNVILGYTGSGFQGNIGVGTTSPWRTLSVNGSSDLGINALAGYFTATSSTASTFPYASTTALTVSGTNGLQLASTLKGAIQAINGLISATSTLSIAYGGTGLSTAPTYGQFLMGNALNAYALTATSSLGLLGSSTVSSLTNNYIPKWNSNGTFVNSLVYDNGTNVGIGTTNPSYPLDVAGFINTNQYSGYKQAGNTVLYASTTNDSLAVGSSGAAAWMSASSTLWQDVAVGIGALATTPTNANDSQNTAIGYSALNSNTTGGNDTAQGFEALYNNTSGTSNTAQGFDALFDNTTGNYNIGEGSYTLFDNTSATSSTAVGYLAGHGTGLYSNQGGTYVGYQSGYSASTGSNYNTLLGYQSGYDVTTGANNLILGTEQSTGSGITTGSNNILLGEGVDAGLSQGGNNQLNIGNLIFGTGLGTGSTMGSGNVGIGTTSPYASLSVSTSTANYTGQTLLSVANSSNSTLFNVLGNGNVGIGTTNPGSLLDVNGFINTNGTSGGYKIDGNLVLQASSTGIDLFVGQSAGNAFTTGQRNIAMGYQALNSVTSQGDNVALGYQALKSYNTLSGFNTAIGSESMLHTTSGNSNVAVGYAAMFGSSTASVSTGGNNTAVGVQALSSYTNGSSNTAIGISALSNLTTGTNNVGVGANALNGIVTGFDVVGIGAGALASGDTNHEVAIGFNALNAQTGGSQNMAFGDTALADLQSGSFNDAFGYSALGVATTTSSNSAFGRLSLSALTCVGSTCGNQNTGFGAQTLQNVTSGSNNTAIGYLAGQDVTTGSHNIVVGAEDSTADGLTTGSNNIVIGNNTSALTAGSSNQLDIGNLIFGTGLSGTGSTIAGSVGIGTTSPWGKLSITGSGTGSTPDFIFANSSNVTQDVIEDNGNVGIGTTSPQTLLGLQGGIGVSSSQLYLQANGNVAIGTNNPYYPNNTLSVVNNTPGGIATISVLNTDGTNANSREDVLVGQGESSDYGYLGYFNSGYSGSGYSAPNTTSLVGTGSGGLGFLDVNGPTAFYTTGFSGNADMILKNNGNLGVGTTSPYASLSVSTSTANYTGQTLLSVANSSNSTLFNVLGNGNVGIGTTSPYANLSVAGTSVITATSTFLGNISNITATNSSFVMQMASTTVGAGAGTDNVVVSGHYAYVLNQTSNDLYVLDVSNPASPALIGTAPLSGTTPQVVAVYGHYAYITNFGSNNLDVVDISNPSAPIQVGTSSGSGLTHPETMAFSGHYMYVGNGGANSVAVVDISNPVSPTVTGTVATGIDPSGLVISGRYLYTNCNFGPCSVMNILDISNPASPTLATTTSFALASSNLLKYALAVSGRYAYFLSSLNTTPFTGTLYVMDISNPVNPTVVGTITVGNNLSAIAISGRYAYVTAGVVTLPGSNNMFVIDISNPTNPTLVDTVPMAIRSNIVISGRYAYAAAGLGLTVLDLSGTETTSLTAGTAGIGQLQVWNDITAGGQLNVLGSINSGNGLSVSGSAGISASTTGNQNFSLFSINNATGTAPILAALYSGQVGIGTTSPWATLSVSGTVSLASLTTEAGVSGSALCLSGTGSNEVVVNSGTATCTLSSERYKHDIQTLSVSSALGILSDLQPSSFVYNADPDSVTHWGFIAEQLASTSPELADYGPDGLPQSIDEPGLLAINTLALQAEQAEIVGLSSATSSPLLAVLLNATSSPLLASLLSATSSPLLDTTQNQPFMVAFVQEISNYLASATSFMFARLQATLAIFTNVQTQTLQTGSLNTTTLQTGTLQAQTASVSGGLQMTDQATGQVYCVTILNGNFDKEQGTCANQTSGLSGSNNSNGTSQQGSGGDNSSATSTSDSGTISSTTSDSTSTPPIPPTPPSSSQPPVISINGDNPAQVQLGSTYDDLGARITGPTADLNLGIQTSGTVDTSTLGTYTIVYVATDQNGLTATSTRTVNVYDPNAGNNGASNDQTATSTTD